MDELLFHGSFKKISRETVSRIDCFHDEAEVETLAAVLPNIADSFLKTRRSIYFTVSSPSMPFCTEVQFAEHNIF